MKSLDIGRKKKEPQLPLELFSFIPPDGDPRELVFVVAPERARSLRPRQTAQSRLHQGILKFKKSFVLVPFTIFVLVVGTVIGTRFVHFASSVSLSGTSAYRSVADTIGAALGNNIPVLKTLDQTSLQDAIRGKRRVNILLLGYGGDNHQGAHLTDSIMVLNLDFSNNQAALISVPRDTWVKIPTSGLDGGFWKVNASYAFGLDDRAYPHKLPEFMGPAGGGNLAKYEISKIVGMPIDYFIAVDFDGFQKIVNDLGGVEVTVDNTFTDYSYPESDQNIDGAWCIADDSQIQPLESQPAPTDCRYKKVHFDAGAQFMDGERALEYARSRHAPGIEGSDFARSKRQQKLLSAIERKALSINALPKIFGLMQDIQGHFQTDMSLAEVKDLYSYLSSINLDKARRLSIDDNGLLVAGTSQDGQYILTPQAGLENWSQIQTYIFEALNGINQTKNSAGQPVAAH